MKIPNSPAYACGDTVICLTKKGWNLYDLEEFEEFVKSQDNYEISYLLAVRFGTGSKDVYQSFHVRLMESMEKNQRLPTTYDTDRLIFKKEDKEDFLAGALKGALMLLNEIDEPRIELEWIEEEPWSSARVKLYKKSGKLAKLIKKKETEVASDIEIELASIERILLKPDHETQIFTTGSVYTITPDADVIRIRKRN